MRSMMMLSLALPTVISIATGALAQQQTPPRRPPTATTQQRPNATPAAPAPAPATRSVTPGPSPSQTTTQLQTPFSQGQSGPITVDADRLEIRDKEKKAIFTGNVVATRGEATVRSAVMVVFYAGDVAGTQTPTPSTPATPTNQQVRRIEMTGKVLLNQRDQTVTGDNGVYEHEGERETLTVTGNVVVTKGQDVIKGTKLVVDLHTNQAQVDSGPGERVRAILVPNDAQTPAPGATSSTAPATPAAPPRTTPPQRPRN